jgi:hypothetical protein
MTAATENARKLPGDLEFLTPQCPICAEHTDAGDRSLSCHGCGIAWDKRGENPVRIDSDAKQCASLYTPYWRDAEYRCWRDAEHVGKHYNPDSFYGWDDDEQTGEATS